MSSEEFLSSDEPNGGPTNLERKKSSTPAAISKNQMKSLLQQRRASDQRNLEAAGSQMVQAETGEIVSKKLLDEQEALAKERRDAAMNSKNARENRGADFGRRAELRAVEKKRHAKIREAVTEWWGQPLEGVNASEDSVAAGDTSESLID